MICEQAVPIVLYTIRWNYSNYSLDLESASYLLSSLLCHLCPWTWFSINVWNPWLYSSCWSVARASPRVKNLLIPSLVTFYQDGEPVCCTCCSLLPTFFLCWWPEAWSRNIFISVLIKCWKEPGTLKPMIEEEYSLYIKLQLQLLLSWAVSNALNKEFKPFQDPPDRSDSSGLYYHLWLVGGGQYLGHPVGPSVLRGLTQTVSLRVLKNCLTYFTKRHQLQCGSLLISYYLL